MTRSTSTGRRKPFSPASSAKSSERVTTSPGCRIRRSSTLRPGRRESELLGAPPRLPAAEIHAKAADDERVVGIAVAGPPAVGRENATPRLLVSRAHRRVVDTTAPARNAADDDVAGCGALCSAQQIASRLQGGARGPADARDNEDVVDQRYRVKGIADLAERGAVDEHVVRHGARLLQSAGRRASNCSTLRGSSIDVGPASRSNGSPWTW